MLLKLVKRFPRYRTFFVFHGQDLQFLKFSIYIGICDLDGGAASLCQNFVKIGQSRVEIIILRFFTAILDLRDSLISLANGFQRAKEHDYAKFHWNQLIYCGYVAIYQLFKMAMGAIFDF